jgi:hypothetical protein
MARRSAWIATLSTSLLLAAASAPAAAAEGEAITDRAEAPAKSAEETPVRVARPLAVRAEMNFLYDGLFSSTDAFLGVTAAYSLDENLSVEGTFGWGGDSFGNGANLMAIGRFAFPLDRRGVHAITFAVGPSSYFGSAYGPVWIARGEIAYELRARGGFSLLVGGGPSLVLADSKVVHRACDWFCLGGSEAQFKAGDVPVQFRVAAGWAF